MEHMHPSISADPISFFFFKQSYIAYRYRSQGSNEECNRFHCGYDMLMSQWGKECLMMGANFTAPTVVLC